MAKTRTLLALLAVVVVVVVALAVVGVLYSYAAPSSNPSYVTGNGLSETLNVSVTKTITMNSNNSTVYINIVNNSAVLTLSITGNANGVTLRGGSVILSINGDNDYVTLQGTRLVGNASIVGNSHVIVP